MRAGVGKSTPTKHIQSDPKVIERRENGGRGGKNGESRLIPVRWQV